MSTIVNFANCAQTLSDVASNYKDKMPISALRAVEDYICHNEFGVAFEELCNALFEDDLSISEEDYVLIEKIGIFLSMDKSNWEFLNPSRGN